MESSKETSFKNIFSLQSWLLSPFSFETVQRLVKTRKKSWSSLSGIAAVTTMLILVLGSLYIAGSWATFIYQILSYAEICSKMKLSITLTVLIAALHDFTVTIRGPLILSFLLFKARSIRHLLDRTFPQIFRFQQLQLI